jgi:hypothetical protein
MEKKRRSANLRRPAKTTLSVLGTSPRKRVAGEIFVCRPAGHDYYFGRVIDPEVRFISWVGVLVYIFDVHAPEKEPVPEDLSPRSLLLPPMILAPACWTSKRVQTVATLPLSAGDVLKRHCFYNPATERFVDEHNKPLRRRIEPCGGYGLTPVGGLDNKISRALRIPLATD